ncbi:MAG: ankyrin repeat domain-containing protein [Alphaproteobacteria bacterium]|nr:ankyrin repeat domain-containing protein [Alphaproteobacteria bacterium]
MKKFAVILSFATLTSSVLGMNNIPQNIKGVMGISAEGWAQPAIVGFGTRTPGSSHIIFENPEKEKIFSQLVILATDGDIVEFKSLLEKNLDLKESSNVKNTLLSFAVSGGQYEIVRWLIESGADVINIEDMNKDTPLSLAFRRKNADIARLLMNHILSKESTKSAAEMISNLIKTVPDGIEKSTVEEIKLLIYSFVKQQSSKGISISSKGLEEDNVYSQKKKNPNFDSRRTARSTVFSRNKMDSKKVVDNLVFFIQKGDVEKLKSLLNEHPEIHPNLILSIAAEKEQFDVVKYAIDHGANPNVVDINLTTPLISASINGNFRIIKYLIDKGARVNEKDKSNYTALIYATKNNRTDIAKYLIERGADVNALSGDQDTPIMWASKHNNYYVVKLLLKHGAEESINVANKYGMTTVLWCVHNGNVEMLEDLRKHGADLNQKEKMGFTPLALAAKNNNFKMVKYLVEHGANVNVQNNDGDTPVQLAGKNKNREMVKFLIESIKPATAA